MSLKSTYKIMLACKGFKRSRWKQFSNSFLIKIFYVTIIPGIFRSCEQKIDQNLHMVITLARKYLHKSTLSFISTVVDKTWNACHCRKLIRRYLHHVLMEGYTLRSMMVFKWNNLHPKLITSPKLLRCVVFEASNDCKLRSHFEYLAIFV